MGSVELFVIGYDPDFAPVTFRNASGEADGAAIHLIAEACGRAGIECRFVPVQLGEQWQQLASGSVTALAAIGATAARRTDLDLSAAYLLTGAAWFAPIGEPFDPDAAVAGTCVATPAGGPLLELIAGRWPQLNPIGTADYATALAAVRDGDAAAAALNIDVGRQMCTDRHPGAFQLPEWPFAEIGLALACRAGACPATLSRLSAALPQPRRLPLDLGGANEH